MSLEDLSALGGFGCIYADPPWLFNNRSAKGERKNPNQQYPCMKLADIKALPVERLAMPDCWLWMWATSPMLPEALDVMSAWGFQYKSTLTWVKQSKLSGGLHVGDKDHKLTFGTGYILRSSAEFVLIGSRGRPVLKRSRAAKAIRSVLLSPVREHSRKPDEMRTIIETRVHGPYVELFGRTASMEDWVVWGNEVGKF